MSQNGDAVRIAGLGVRFFLQYEKGPGGAGIPSFLRRRGRRELWALRGLDLTIGKGEIFGVIGANGAGKSTLLKVLAGIFPPTEGAIAVDGKLAPFIELGAAFNPELTGAENIFLTGSIYRVPRREIRENFDRIVEFSELRNFIDTPVKNYSSGMFVRLAFSSILFFAPDILLVDEVFSVGDEAFQQKSFEKVIAFKSSGATVIIVSHDSALDRPHLRPGPRPGPGEDVLPRAGRRGGRALPRPVAGGEGRPGHAARLGRAGRRGGRGG